MVEPSGNARQVEIVALKTVVIALTRRVQDHARSLDQCRAKLDGLVRSVSWLTVAQLEEMRSMLTSESREVDNLEGRLAWLVQHVSDLENRR